MVSWRYRSDWTYSDQRKYNKYIQDGPLSMHLCESDIKNVLLTKQELSWAPSCKPTVKRGYPRYLGLSLKWVNDYVSDYPNRLHNTKLFFLSFIKDINDLCFFYKCIHNSIDIRHIFYFINADTTLVQHVFPLRIVGFNSELAGLFIDNHIGLEMWNILPNIIKIMPCCNKFAKPFMKLLYRV